MAGLLLSLMLAACASDRDAASTPVVPDGTPTAIENSAQFSVGVVEGDTTRQFHRVIGPFLLPDGKLAVPVEGDLAIRVFTPDGELARTLGGPGEGPGELAALNAAWARGDTIEAFDHESRRITRYLPDGTTETVRLEGIASAQAALPEAPSDGWILVGVADGGVGRRDEVAVHRFERDGSHAGVIARAEGMTRFRTPVAGGPDPLSPRAVFAVHENEVYLAETLTARIEVLDLNGTLKREIAWQPAEPPSPENAFRSVVDAVTARRAPDDRAAARRQLESFEVQDRVSVFWDLMVDEEGFIWVQPFDPERHALALTGYGGTAPGGEWMILSPDGERVGTIRMPGRLRPTHITADAVAGVRRNALGVQFVDVHSLERSRRAEQQAAEAEVTATIGRVEGPDEYLFGDITSVAADRSGRIYVADRIGSTVRVYDTEGAFLRRLGREGEGPGEYEHPADLTFGPDGRLYVRDANRVTVLAPTAPGAIPDSVAATWRIPGFANLDSRRGRVDASGRYHYPHYRFVRGEPPRYFYLVYPDAAHRGDTVHVPAYPMLSANRSAFYRVDRGTGRMVEGLAHAPFEPVAGWDITPRGTVVGGDARSPELLETNATGDTLRTLDGERDRRPVPESERADSTRALQARIDSLPVPLSDVQRVSDAVRTGELPDSLPAYRSVHIGTEGDIWVERWPPAGEADRRFFDVLAPDGTHRTSVVLPAPLLRDPPPFFTHGAVYGVVRDPATGVERVVKLGFEPEAIRENP